MFMLSVKPLNPNSQRINVVVEKLSKPKHATNLSTAIPIFEDASITVGRQTENGELKLMLLLSGFRIMMIRRIRNLNISTHHPI